MDITKAHDKKEPFHKIFLVYEYEQPLYKQYKEWFSDRIVITNQLSDIDLEDASAEANGRPNLLILDDCLLKLSSNNRDANQFLSLMTGSSHHLRFFSFFELPRARTTNYETFQNVCVIYDAIILSAQASVLCGCCEIADVIVCDKVTLQTQLYFVISEVLCCVTCLIDNS